MVTDYCISQNYTIKEAIDSIDAGTKRVAIVLDEEERVVGIISQGDIIRALAQGMDLYSRVAAILRPNFYYLNEKDMKAAYAVFKGKSITLLPVVGEDFRLLDVITIDDIYAYLEKRAK